jgi:hypothetical protein
LFAARSGAAGILVCSFRDASGRKVAADFGGLDRFVDESLNCAERYDILQKGQP